jgi:4'-phosphopantetheinyl transferase
MMLGQPDQLWFPPPTDLALSRDEVHVWRASLDQPASRVQNLRQTLTTRELDRAGRFHLPEDHQHFIVARGLLRAILGRYLDVEPSRLRFGYGVYGKPYLVSTYGPNELKFNLSYSNGLALYAVTRGREIGIDLEYVRPIPEAGQIVERFFSASENAVFRALPAGLRQRAFFTCWTRKEAYVKAKGEGLSLRLDWFDVSLMPGEPAVQLNVRGSSQESSRWSLRELMPGPDHVATLAVEGSDWHLACWQWPEPISTPIGAGRG